MHDRIRAEHKEFKPMPIKKMNILENDQMKRRYIVLFETLDATLPIKRVIVCPSRRQQANLENARKLIGDKFPIHASATPFIG